MKVIHYISTLDQKRGGVATYMQCLSKELGKRCDLVVVTRQSANQLSLTNCSVFSLPHDKKSFVSGFMRILDEERPDIVHLNGIWQHDLLWVQKESQTRGIITFITPHGMLLPWSLRHNVIRKAIALLLYERKALRAADMIFATDKCEHDEIVKLKLTKKPVPIISNGIDIEGYSIKESWKVRKKILFLSRISIGKGIELLFEAMFDIKEPLYGYEIIIAGEGESAYIDKLKNKAKRLGLNVSFVGGVYGEAKFNLIKDSDFMVLPTFSENFGYVIAESLICGTPVITTKGTPWEDIETLGCGRWIERTRSELSTAILQMISRSSSDLEQMGRNGRKLIESKYTSASMAEFIMKIYNGKGVIL